MRPAGCLLSAAAFLGARAVKVWDLDYYDQLLSLQFSANAGTGCQPGNTDNLDSLAQLKLALENIAAEKCTADVVFTLKFNPPASQLRLVDPVLYSPGAGKPTLQVTSFVLDLARLQRRYPEVGQTFPDLTKLTLASVALPQHSLPSCASSTLRRLTSLQTKDTVLTPANLVPDTNPPTSSSASFTFAKGALFPSTTPAQFVLIPDRLVSECSAAQIEVSKSTTFSISALLPAVPVKPTVRLPQAPSNLNGWSVAKLGYASCVDGTLVDVARTENWFRDALNKRDQPPAPCNSPFVLNLTNSGSSGFQPATIRGAGPVTQKAPAFLLGSYARNGSPLGADPAAEGFLISQGIGNARWKLTALHLQNVVYAVPGCNRVQLLARVVPSPFAPSESLATSDFVALGTGPISTRLVTALQPVLEPGSLLHIVLQPPPGENCTLDVFPATSVSIELTSESPMPMVLADYSAGWDATFASNVAGCENADDLEVLVKCATARSDSSYIASKKMTSQRDLYPYLAPGATPGTTFQRSAAVFLKAEQFKDTPVLVSIEFQGARFVPRRCNEGVKVKVAQENELEKAAVQDDVKATGTEKSLTFTFPKTELGSKDVRILFEPPRPECQIWGPARISVTLSKTFPAKPTPPEEGQVDLNEYKNSWTPAYRITVKESCVPDVCTGKDLPSQVALLDCLNRIRVSEKCMVEVSNNVTSQISKMVGFQQGSSLLPSMIFGSYKGGGPGVLDRVVLDHTLGQVNQQLLFKLSSVAFGPTTSFQTPDCNDYRVGVMAELQDLLPLSQLEEAEVPNEQQSVSKLPAGYTFATPLTLQHNRRQLVLLPQSTSRSACTIGSYQPSALFKSAPLSVAMKGLLSPEVKWLLAGYRLRDVRFCAPVKAECRSLIPDADSLGVCVNQARLPGCHMSISMVVNSNGVLFGEMLDTHLIPAVTLGKLELTKNSPSRNWAVKEEVLTFQTKYLRSINFGNTFYRHLCNHVTLVGLNAEGKPAPLTRLNDKGVAVFSTDRYHTFLPEVRFSARYAPELKNGRITATPLTKEPGCLWTGGKVTMELNTGPQSWELPKTGLPPTDASIASKTTAMKPQSYRIAPGVCEKPVEGACYQRDFELVSDVEHCLTQMKASKCSATVMATLKIPMTLNGIPLTFQTWVVPGLLIPKPDTILTESFNLIGVDFSGQFIIPNQAGCNKVKLFRPQTDGESAYKPPIDKTRLKAISEGVFVLPGVAWLKPLEVTEPFLVLAVPENSNSACNWPALGTKMPTLLYSTREIPSS